MHRYVPCPTHYPYPLPSCKFCDAMIMVVKGKRFPLTPRALAFKDAFHWIKVMLAKWALNFGALPCRHHLLEMH